ncbi:MAG: 23S rRNA (uracil(1939)-C(5))-methyltransferase RlmD [Roseiflexaceae bacterium]
MTITTLSPKQFRNQIVGLARVGEEAIPRCQHAIDCGGCTFQQLSYAAQVEAKHAALRTLWSGDLSSDQIAAIGMVGSPDPFNYRTRMDYVCSKDRFGLRRSGKYNYIIDLAECHLIPNHAFAIARSVYSKAIELGLPDYNLRSHVGFLRYVVVRRSPSDQLLLAFITAAPDAAGQYEAAIEQVATLALATPGVQGFHWLVNETVTDISFGQSHRIWGSATLSMPVGERTLAIGPNTFFQNNVHLLLPLLDDVANLVGRAGCVADLYGGVGTIALHLANQVESIITVESVAESAQLARINSQANQLSNVQAVEADTLAYLRGVDPGQFDVIVADPPRAGMGPDVCRELLRIRPQRIVYVSCNALTQLDDLRALVPGYQLRELRGYDMFPQTPHLEALALLEALPATP